MKIPEKLEDIKDMIIDFSYKSLFIMLGIGWLAFAVVKSYEDNKN